MSYCRKDGTSDVYLISTGNGFICYRCRLLPDFLMEDKNLFSRTETILHLKKHRAAGHRVPQSAFDRLRKELATLGET